MSETNSMRVESLNLPLKEPFETALGAQYNAPNVIVFVKTETNVVGLDEGSPGHCVTGETQGATFNTISKASELLVGRGVASYRAIIENLHATLPNAVSSLFVLETAIIDACYREIDIPMAELFGGSPGVIETDMTIPIHTPDIAARRAESAVQSGFEALKIKVGEDLEMSIQRVRSVSEAAPNATITVDANREWFVSETIIFDQAMHDVGIFLSLLEQPVVKSGTAGLVSVRSRARTPIGADEAVFTPEDAVRIIRNDTADVINIELGKSGLLGAADTAAITRAAGRDLMMDCMLGSSIDIHTNAHLVSGIGGFSHINFDVTRLLDDDVIDRESGPMIIPSGPGHGITPNW